MSSSSAASQPHYQAPGWFTRNIFNRAVAGLTRAGVSVLGQPGAGDQGPHERPAPPYAGQPARRSTAERYLVSPRGEGQWVRNVRADGGRLTLLLGRKREELTAVEVPPAEREPILRAYLKRWKAEVGMFFDGVDADSSAEELARIAPKHPVFRLSA